MCLEWPRKIMEVPVTIIVHRFQPKLMNKKKGHTVNNVHISLWQRQFDSNIIYTMWYKASATVTVLFWGFWVFTWRWEFEVSNQHFRTSLSHLTGLRGIQEKIYLGTLNVGQTNNPKTVDTNHNSPQSIKIFKIRKMIVRIVTNSRSRDWCRNIFKTMKILPFYSQLYFLC
jgi:hypothetical protein